MSGLFSAAFLRQVGWDCDVYERSGGELVGRGAGITTHPELLEALEKSGAGTRDLGIEVIAEGVETAQEYHWFADQGVRLFQGYLFARPAFEGFPPVHYPH